MKISDILDSTPAWESDDDAKRLTAVESGELEPGILEKLAQSDPAEEVRIAAVGRIEAADLLEQIVAAGPDAVSKVASASLARVIESSHQPDLQTLSATALSALVRHASDPAVREAAVAPLDAGTKLTLLGEDLPSAVLQACASGLESPEDLDHVRKAFLHKDKNVLRIVRQKLGDMRQVQFDAEIAGARRAGLCEAAEKLAATSDTEQFGRRVDALRQAWSAIPEDDDGLAARFTTAIDQCESRLADEAAEATARQQLCESLVNRLVGLVEQAASGKYDTLATDLAAVQNEWPQDGSEFIDPVTLQQWDARNTEVAAITAALDITATLDSLKDADSLAAALGRVNWPETLPVPAQLVAARERLATLNQEADASAEEARRVESSLAARMQTLEQHINQGNLKGANKSRSGIDKVLKKAPEVVRKAQREDVHKLDLRLQELKDWHTFATQPKRVELCEKMEALITETTIEPPERARAIKELQEAWKALGPSDSAASQRLWSRFSKAGDDAFAPCAEFFNQQHETRKQNAKARQEICATLELYSSNTDWSTVNWQDVRTVLANAGKGWREYDDVPHAQRRKLQKRFESARAPIQDRLNGELEKNKAAKQALIDEMEAALAGEQPLDTLIATAKSLQQRWKSVGIMDRKTDQKLWKKFRQACDRVFEQRDAEKNAEKAAVKTATNEARNLAKSFRTSMQSPDFDRKTLRDFEQRFNAMEVRDGRTRKEWSGLVKQARQQIANVAKASRKAEVIEARRLARLCQAVEEGQANPDTLETEWDSDIDLPTDISDALQARRVAAGSPSGQELEQRRDAAAMLCVRAEILAGLDSPPEAQSIRMQYQVDRLNRELSRGEKETRSADEQARELLFEWYALGALPNDCAELRGRFENAESILLGGEITAA